MNKLQRGFTTSMLLAVIVILVVGGGVYIYKNKKIETSAPIRNQQAIEQGLVVMPSSQNNQQVSVSNWKTHVNSELGYSISYPSTYHLAYGNDLFNYDENLYERRTSTGVKIQIQKLDGNFNISKTDVPIIKFSEKVTNGPGGTFDIYSVTGLNGIKYFRILVWGMENDSQNVLKILQTFKFVSTNSNNTVSQNQPTTCVDQLEAKAVITSLSSYFGSIGTKLEIRGCNFAGFEGDKIAVIENPQGVRGILYGESGSTAKIIKVTLKSPLCQQDNSYSDLPCDAYLTLTPGTYKIYTTPWGVNTKSNLATFTIQ